MPDARQSGVPVRTSGRMSRVSFMEPSPADQARAHKYLAFIVCVNGREKVCRDEFRAALRFLQEFPSAVASHEGIQRIPVRGFPYVLVFDVATNRVLALAHTSRRPGYWRDRR